jgi:hypothetical protein
MALFHLVLFTLNFRQMNQSVSMKRVRRNNPVSFKYYSTFSGCSQSSKCAVTFSRGLEGLMTGNRIFTENHDLYQFSEYKITLANSTGNTEARFSYPDESGKVRTVTVRCKVRDYEYGEC